MVKDDAKPLLSPTQPSVTSVESEQKFTFFLGFAVFVSVLSSFQFGWNIGSTNSPENFIRFCDGPGDSWLPTCIPMDAAEWGTVIGMFSFGGLFGGMSGGFLAGRYGRKPVLLFNNLFFIVGGLLMGFSLNLWMFGAGRFFLGLGSGLGSSVVPMYVSEMSPTKYRGTLGALHQLGIVVGILSTQLLGLVLGEPPYWRVLVGLTAAIAVVQLIGLSFSAESPRHLVNKGHIEAARNALKRFRNTSDIDNELDHMVESYNRELESSRAISLANFFTVKPLRRALFLAVLCQISQQFCGINGVVQYSTAIFSKIMPKYAQLFTVLIGVGNLIFTLIAVALMDLAGRRVLLLGSQFGVGLVTLGIVLSSYFAWDLGVVIGVPIFVAIFAVGLGPVPWLIIPEIFPAYAVGQAASIGVMLNWTCSFVVTTLFPILSSLLGVYLFLPFAILSLILGIITAIILPETRGKSIAEVVAHFE